MPILSPMSVGYVPFYRNMWTMGRIAQSNIELAVTRGYLTVAEARDIMMMSNPNVPVVDWESLYSRMFTAGKATAADITDAVSLGLLIPEQAEAILGA